MRKILDPVKPSELRKAFRAVYSNAQRGKVLEDFAIFDNRYLMSIDGTALHSSAKVRCPQCGVKKHHIGEIEYYYGGDRASGPEDRVATGLRTHCKE